MSAGAFVRQQSRFRGRPQGGPEQYHLYVARACPWAHRALIVRALSRPRGGDRHLLRAPLSATIAAGRSPATAHVDQLNGFDLLSEAYERTDPAFEGRVSVPVLWDKVTGRILERVLRDHPDAQQRVRRVRRAP